MNHIIKVYHEKTKICKSQERSEEMVETNKKNPPSTVQLLYFIFTDHVSLSHYALGQAGKRTPSFWWEADPEEVSWGHKEQRAWSLVRRGLLAKYLAGVSVTTECLSGGKWLLYTTALWP